MLGEVGGLQKGPPFHGLRSCRAINMQNESCHMGGASWCGKISGREVTSLQGDKSTPHFSMELYDPWISGPLRVS